MPSAGVGVCEASECITAPVVLCLLLLALAGVSA